MIMKAWHKSSVQLRPPALEGRRTPYATVQRHQKIERTSFRLLLQRKESSQDWQVKLKSVTSRRTLTVSTHHIIYIVNCCGSMKSVVSRRGSSTRSERKTRERGVVVVIFVVVMTVTS